MDSPPRIRQLVEEPQFTREKRLVEPSDQACDAMLDGMTFIIARNPRRGHKAYGRIWCIAEEPPGRDPIVVFYTFTDDVVTLVSIVKGKYLA